MSTQVLILVIAAVAGASAITGYALGRFSGTRQLRDTDASRSRLGATLATVPGGFVTWLDGGDPVVSDGLTAMLDDGVAGFDGFLGKFGEADRQRITRLIEGLQTRGEGFSLTMLTIDAGQALRIDGRRARDVPLDVLWVADVTNETAIQSDTAIQLTAAQVERDGYRAMLDALPFMVWRRSRDLALAQVNRAYVDAINPEAGDSDARPSELENLEANVEAEIAARAQSTGTPQSESRHVVIDGARRLLEFNE
ncbi:MAG: hypothetical protein HN420_06015, partial [Rhodospirillaceae bacterium]|nr:hypothetical protein [Rhodospirillaceae bacterium]